MHEQTVAEIESAGAKYRGIMERAYSREGGKANAIKAMCLHCTGYVRREITECVAPRCPLHAYRPYQDGDDDPEIAVKSSQNRFSLSGAGQGTSANRDEPEIVSSEVL